MSGDANKALVRAYVKDVWINHDLDALERYIADDYVQHSKHATPGREGLKAFFKGLWEAFTEQSFSIDDLIAEGDRVVWRWTMRARHSGPFFGIAATGRTITATGISIFRIAGDRFVEHWGEQDTAGLLAQLRG
ncbi:MAG TPA: ester cyclase [Polyangia bacterium]|nr:ester cyclase [Polyangia bacterium]